VSSDVDELRQRMARIRDDLQRDAARLADNAHTLTDWRYYVGRHPWICLGASAALGYLLVPTKRRVPSPDPQALAELARQHRLVLEPEGTKAQVRGTASAIKDFLRQAVLRSALAYAGRKIGDAFAPKERAAEEEPLFDGKRHPR